ncbi:sialic acid-binding Ig-like lectin 13 [Brachionichthys hirsutus]|uniref:sialic acid-binding Ig-like lectin 13 n=1 Tax=Brachionichthys hirsutus TaxID=412623 RepID=UPI003604D49C
MHDKELKSSVHAVAGSCVVIPCSFTPRAPHHHLKGRKERVDVRLMFKGGSRFFPLLSTAFNSGNRDQASRNFQGRTSLFGRITEGDCSVKIERLSRDDAMLFEMALKRRDELLWGRPRSFSLVVAGGTLSATEGQLVTLNCSVSYYCPSGPPALQWVWERGAQLNGTDPVEVQKLHPEPQRLMLLSPLSFIASHKVKPRLRCEARYPGAKALSTLRDLHVTFAPKDVMVQVWSLMVQEGGSAWLACSCKADPPVSEYRWSYSQHGRMVQVPKSTHAIRVFNVTRDMRVCCTAKNRIGQGESQPTLLDVQYKPSILQLSSACLLDDLEILCRCSVDSNPKPEVTWSVNGTVPSHAYNMSATSELDSLTATLRGHMEKPETVICFAANALGNDSLMLLQGGEETVPLLWMVIPAVAVSVAIFSLVLFLVCLRKRKRVVSRRPAAYPEGLGIYQDRMPLYINCTEVTHIYTNGSYQLVSDQWVEEAGREEEEERMEE